MLARLLDFADRRACAEIGLACAILIFGFGFLDYVTGERLSFAVFYLGPIALAAWELELRWALVAVVVSAVVSSAADGLSRGAMLTDGVTYWNLVARGGIFLAAAMTLSWLHGSLVEERALARVDALTGTANRRQFEELAEAELRRGRRSGKPLTCLYVDVDDLKVVNDRFGHHQGDALLVVVAGSLRETVRVTDVVARLGGDEFGVLLPETGLNAAEVVIAKVMRSIRAAAADSPWPFTVSLGGVAFATMPGSLHEMIIRADAVMYEIKAIGKDAARLIAA